MQEAYNLQSRYENVSRKTEFLASKTSLYPSHVVFFKLEESLWLIKHHAIKT